MNDFRNFLSGMRPGRSGSPGAGTGDDARTGPMVPMRGSRLIMTKILGRKIGQDDKPGYGGVGGDPAPSAAASQAPKVEAGGPGGDPQRGPSALGGTGGNPQRAPQAAGGGAKPTGGIGGDP